MKKDTKLWTFNPQTHARQARAILAELQKTLLPGHASEIVGINVDTREYVLGSTPDEVWTAFRERWPNSLAFVIRVDGGPVTKFHGI
jgi:hypothetical protein